jgi:hypothetical protein
MAKARRASRWQRSGLGADSHAFGSGTALFNAAIAQMTENNAARNQAADADDLEATAFDTCPNCGSGAWTEQKAPKHPAT